MSFSRPSSIRSPAENSFHFVHIGQIIKEKVGFALRQPLPRPGTGRDRDGARAERFPAGDVVAGIPNDVDLLWRKIDSSRLLRAREGEGAEFVAIRVIVGERAERDLHGDVIRADSPSRKPRGERVLSVPI